MNKRQRKKLAKKRGIVKYDKTRLLNNAIANENPFMIKIYKARYGDEWRDEYLHDNQKSIGNVAITGAYTTNDELVDRANIILDRYFNTLPVTGIELNAYENDLRYIIKNENDIFDDYEFVSQVFDRNSILRQYLEDDDFQPNLLRQALSKHKNLSLFLRDIQDYTKEIMDIFDTFPDSFIMASY